MVVYGCDKLGELTRKNHGCVFVGCSRLKWIYGWMINEIFIPLAISVATIPWKMKTSLPKHVKSLSYMYYLLIILSTQWSQT